MKCRRFELDVADWVAGRLSGPQAAEMGAHEKQCARCHGVAESERQLQASMAAMPAASLRRDLWPELAVRLEQNAPKPVRRRWPILSRLLLTGGVAAALGLLVARVALKPAGSKLAQLQDEERVVLQMTQLEPVQYVEADVAAFAAYQGHELQRVVLMGDTGSER